MIGHGPGFDNGEILAISPAAAKMKVYRGLDRLRIIILDLR